MQRLEAALRCPLAQHPPGAHRYSEALQHHCAEILIIKEPADQPPRVLGDHHPIRRGERLQPGSQIRRFAEHRLRLRCLAADQIADDDETGREPETNPQFESRRRVRRMPGGGDLERGAHRAFGIVLVRRRMAEQDQHAIANVATDDTAIFADDRHHAIAISGNDLS